MEATKKLLWTLPVGVVGIAAVFVIGTGMMIVLFMTSLMGNQVQEFSSDVQLSDIGANEIPAEYIDFYKRAGEAFGIPWTLLAGIHRVETTFSTNKNDSYVGATGAMQFMPCTWVGWSHPSCGGVGKGNISKSELLDPAAIERYGGYGVDANGDGKADPMSEEDAIMAAAKYLKANGADGTREGMRKAVYAYNHADWYVDEVLSYFDQYTLGYEVIEVGKVNFNGGTAFPVVGSYVVTSTFGNRVLDGKSNFHAGIDIAPPGNKKGKDFNVVTFANGKVIAANDGCSQGNYSCGGGYGNYVMIEHDGFITVYAHLKKGTVSAGVGDVLKAGDKLGLMGNTGNSRGKHLHFEVKVRGKKIDPSPYLEAFL
ncbi:peptidoglycan DD-metalloendopeptidase family protein [Bacillus sp. FJAT-47783]|uniref:peptidoglycan DD-metalloendopeptidase family protein n=1 Tax=Bacillus sp. FJAT-47783 TaxID=2922712 RepID=UPI001FAE08BE|nr:peptidoglycan DD-metalloendopeptidase family protein [Bacillus sp. FJAT-47783]